MPPQAMMLFAGGLLILAVISAVVSALETGFFALPPSRMDALRRRRPELAGVLSRIMENPRRLLSALLIADALANAPLMIGSLALIEGQHGLAIPFWASALLLFALIVFACDLVPKLIGLGAPVLVLRLGARLIGKVMPLLDPLARRMEQWSENGQAPIPGTAGDYAWGGAGGTAFWVDPKQDMYVVFMMQSPKNRAAIRNKVRSLVYAAIVK